MKTLLTALVILLGQDEEALKKKQAEIAAFLKTAKTEREFRAVVTDYTRLGLKAEDLLRYEFAAKVYGDAERVARTALKDAALAQSLGESGRRSVEVARQFKKAEAAYFRIEDKKGTPEDYTEVGKFLCFAKGAWEDGLKYLSEGKDETLKQLATSDVFGEKDAAVRVEVGDRWMEVGKKEPVAKERAVHNYAKAWPGLSGVTKEKTRAKIASALSRTTSKGPAKSPAGWTWDKTRIRADETYAHQGKASLVLLPGPVPTPPIMAPLTTPKDGQKLVLSVYVLTEGTTKELSILAGRFTGPDGKEGVFRLHAPADQPWWTRVEQTITLPVGTTKFWVGSGPPDVGTIWLDDVSLKTEDGAELIDNGGFEK